MRVNHEVDALVGPCGRCGDSVPFDVVIDNAIWRGVPNEFRYGVLCLPCIDRVLPEGLHPDSIENVYASTSHGTVALLPVRAK